MSSSSVNDLRAALDDAGSVVQSSEILLAPVRRLSFWVAVALPFLYVPMLLIGLGSTARQTAFLALLCCNAVALLLGHSHLRE